MTNFLLVRGGLPVLEIGGGIGRAVSEEVDMSEVPCGTGMVAMSSEAVGSGWLSIGACEALFKSPNVVPRPEVHKTKELMLVRGVWVAESGQ